MPDKQTQTEKKRTSCMWIMIRSFAVSFSFGAVQLRTGIPDILGDDPPPGFVWVPIIHPKEVRVFSLVPSHCSLAYVRL